MLHLPKLPYAVQRNRAEVVEVQGINFSDNFRPGDIAESKNLSARRFPYIATRAAREKQAAYSGATALAAWEKLVVVQGTQLMYDGKFVGHVRAGEKQFAVVNTKMVIWPDKVYLDINTLSLHDLGAKASGTGAKFTTTTMTVTGWPALTSLFSVGDTVTISGCAANAANNKDVTIKGLSDTVLTVAEGSFQEAEETAALTVERRVPDLDYICESENRLWGCSNSSKTIYASALGDPTNFYTYEGLSTDAYALAVGSEGDFTGCCKLSTSVLFWKENALHKMLGSYPAEYSLYTYNIEGLRRGCHKSLQVINEVLFYMGIHGVYAYSGGSPSLISSCFGDCDMTEAVAGNDGDHYYLSVLDGTVRRFLVYDTRLAVWLQEDDTRCIDFARLGREVYFLSGDGEVWLADTGKEDADVEWLARFTPFYETVQGRKRYSKILLRVEMPRGAWLRAEVRCDGGVWREAGKILGQEHDTTPLRIVFARCDRFEIRLSGHGPCAIMTMLREFSVGSDV